MKIGVVMPIAEDDEERRTPSYQEVREIAMQAEEAGLDSVWVFDHLLFRFDDNPTAGIWECWTVLAALAEATARVELGTIVMCTAFRNPALLAKMAVTLDEISGGRLILGLGAGWHQPEFDAFGYPFDHLASRFEDAMRIIAPLLREGAVDYHGTYATAANAELRPRGPRLNGPPILIAAKQDRMLHLTAEFADSWNTAWLGLPTKLPERRAKLEAACADVGRDPATLEVTVGVSVDFTAASAANGESRDPSKALFGSAAEIAAGLRAYADQGVGHLICSCSPATVASVRSLAEAVAIARAERV